jgi:hypothetical protein
MMSKRCSDVVELRVEHLFSTPKAAGMQLLLRIRNSPGALTLGRADLTMTQCVEPLLYRGLGRLVKRSAQQK